MNARILVKVLALLGAFLCAIAVFGEQAAPDNSVVRATIFASQFPNAALVMLAGPVTLLVAALMLGYRPTTLFALAFAAYASIGLLTVASRVQFSGLGADSPYSVAMIGFLGILAMETKVEPVATPAPMVGGPAMPPDPAPVRGRGAGRG